MEDLGWFGNAMRWLQESGDNQPRVLDLGVHGGYVEKLVVGPCGTEVRKYPEPEAPRHHEFETVDGFVEYLNSAHCVEERWAERTSPSDAPHGNTRRGLVMVGDLVEADLAYRERTTEQAARLRLLETQEFAGLGSLLRAQGVKDAWRVVTTVCRDSFVPELGAQLSVLRVLSARREELDIDYTGLGGGRDHASCRVVVGQSEQGFSTDWDWEGSLWRCFDYPVTVQVRVELEKAEKGLEVRFHLLNLPEVVLETRRALVMALRARVPAHFEVYEGSF